MHYCLFCVSDVLVDVVLLCFTLRTRISYTRYVVLVSCAEFAVFVFLLKVRRMILFKFFNGNCNTLRYGTIFIFEVTVDETRLHTRASCISVVLY